VRSAVRMASIVAQRPPRYRKMHILSSVPPAQWQHRDCPPLGRVPGGTSRDGIRRAASERFAGSQGPGILATPDQTHRRGLRRRLKANDGSGPRVPAATDEAASREAVVFGFHGVSSCTCSSRPPPTSSHRAMHWMRRTTFGAARGPISPIIEAILLEQVERVLGFTSTALVRTIAFGHSTHPWFTPPRVKGHLLRGGI
jgi:hypothetical protein